MNHSENPNCHGWHSLQAINDVFAQLLSSLNWHGEAREWTLPLYSQDCKQAPSCLPLHTQHTAHTRIDTHAGSLKSTHKSEVTDNMTLFYWSYKFCQRRCTWRTHTHLWHKNMTKSTHQPADTTACECTNPHVSVCATHPHVIKHNTHVFGSGGGEPRLEQLEYGATLSSTPHGSRSNQLVSGIYFPCPTPPLSPSDPPLSSNHPCSGMSHPCSVPKETPSAIDQPHTVQCKFHWNSADLYKVGPYVLVHTLYTHRDTKQHKHLWYRKVSNVKYSF